jgi:hypothetical protein
MAEEVTRRLRTVCALYKQQVWLARSQAMRAPLRALDAGNGTLLFRAG